jgi:hypothetical protein
MEFWLLTYAPPSIHVKFVAMLNARVEDQVAVDQIAFSDIIDVCSVQFYSFVLISLNTMGRYAKRQLFYIAFTMKYYGLSRIGLSLLGKYGFGTSISCIDTLSAEHHALTLQKVRYFTSTLKYVGMFSPC